MNILGISCYYHDAAAAILQDGILIAASEEERFSRAPVGHASMKPVQGFQAPWDPTRPLFGEDDAQPWVAVEHPAEDQVMHGNRRVERVADDVDEVVVGEPPRLGKPGRVHEDQHAKLFDPREDLAEAFGRKVFAGDIGRDLDAAEAQ